jgi:hypothetical protein
MSEKPKFVVRNNAAPINALRPLASAASLSQPTKMVAPRTGTQLGQPLNQIRPIPTAKKGK